MYLQMLPFAFHSMSPLLLHKLFGSSQWEHRRDPMSSIPTRPDQESAVTVTEPQKQAGQKEERRWTVLLWQRGELQFSLCCSDLPWNLLGSTMPSRYKSRLLENQGYVWEVRVGRWIHAVFTKWVGWQFYSGSEWVTSLWCYQASSTLWLVLTQTVSLVSSRTCPRLILLYLGSTPIDNSHFGWCRCNWNIIFLESRRFLNLFSYTDD